MRVQNNKHSPNNAIKLCFLTACKNVKIHSGILFICVAYPMSVAKWKAMIFGFLDAVLALLLLLLLFYFWHFIAFVTFKLSRFEMIFGWDCGFHDPCCGPLRERKRKTTTVIVQIWKYRFLCVLLLQSMQIKTDACCINTNKRRLTKVNQSLQNTALCKHARFGISLDLNWCWM